MWRTRAILAIVSVVGVGCALPSQSHRESYAAFDRAAVPTSDGNRAVSAVTNSKRLELEPLVAAVLARNPSIEAARQGWRAALARYPEAASFEDLRVGVSFAPLSLFSSDVKVGFGATISQGLPYFGKRRLRGDVILAEADAKREDYRAVRQRLALMAAHLYYNYFLIDRALEVNAEHVKLLTEYTKTVELKMQVGRAWQDDALKVDVDLAELRRVRVVLQADREVVVAQLNALLHRQPELSLPSPPGKLPVPAAVATSRVDLVAKALVARPELRAVEHRRRGARAQVALADRDYYPDFRVSGTYNRMWPMLEHQIMLGLSFNLPVQRARRRAAVQVAEARVLRSSAEIQRQRDRIRLDIEKALRRIVEADKTLVLYRDKVVPAAKRRVTSIRVGLDANRTSFIEAIRAERELRTVELRLFSAFADAHRRRAELAWAIGETPSADGGKS